MMDTESASARSMETTPMDVGVAPRDKTVVAGMLGGIAFAYVVFGLLLVALFSLVF